MATNNEINNNIPESGAVRVVKRANWKKCEICNVFVTSQQLMDIHVLGRKHNIILRKMNQDKANFYCQICKVHTNSAKQLEDHLAGRMHKWQIEELQNKTEFRFYLLYGSFVTLLLHIIISFVFYILFLLFSE